MRMTQEQYKNIVQGKRNREAGQHFEEIIEEACRHYRLAGSAEIEKTPEPFKVERHIGQGKFIGHFAKTAQPDFKGTVKSGRSVVFEAKHTQTGQMKQDAVTAEQAKAFERHEKMGAECFVLVSFGFKQFYKIPWKTFGNMKNLYGRKYITPEDVSGYKIAYNGFLDFLQEDEK